MILKFVCVKISVKIKGEIIRTVSSRVVPRFSQTSFPVFTSYRTENKTEQGRTVKSFLLSPVYR